MFGLLKKIKKQFQTFLHWSIVPGFSPSPTDVVMVENRVGLSLERQANTGFWVCSYIWISMNYYSILVFSIKKYLYDLKVLPIIYKQFFHLPYTTDQNYAHSKLTFVAQLDIPFSLFWICKKMCNKFNHHGSLYSHIVHYIPFTSLHNIYFPLCTYFKSETYVPMFSQFSSWAWNMWQTGVSLIIIAIFFPWGFTVCLKEPGTTRVQHNHQRMIETLCTLSMSFLASTLRWILTSCYFSVI